MDADARDARTMQRAMDPAAGPGRSGVLIRYLLVLVLGLVCIWMFACPYFLLSRASQCGLISYPVFPALLRIGELSSAILLLVLCEDIDTGSTIRKEAHSLAIVSSRRDVPLATCQTAWSIYPQPLTLRLQYDGSDTHWTAHLRQA